MREGRVLQGPSHVFMFVVIVRMNLCAARRLRSVAIETEPDLGALAGVCLSVCMYVSLSSCLVLLFAGMKL